MENNEYTRAGIRPRSTNSTKHSDDVGVLLPNKVYNWATHNTYKSEVSNPDGYKHQADRSAEIDATRFKGIGIKYSNIGELYN